MGEVGEQDSLGRKVVYGVNAYVMGYSHVMYIISVLLSELLSGIEKVPFNDLNAMERICDMLHEPGLY